MKIALLIAYDGTNYGGWQIQKNTVTVQSVLQEKVSELLGHPVSVCASGRTDSGVHAAGQVCHFSADCCIPPEKIADALNARLPDDISVLKSAKAPDSFDSSRSAKKKTYLYRLYFSERRNPLKDRYSVWVKGQADIAKLKHIAGAFVGEHDFSAYCKSGSKVKTTVREVYSVTVDAAQSPNVSDVEIRVCGGGFLYNMVRTIVGTMLAYAAGSIDESRVLASLTECKRGLVGKTMPAKGLTLESVDYGFLLFKD